MPLGDGELHQRPWIPAMARRQDTDTATREPAGGSAGRKLGACGRTGRSAGRTLPEASPGITSGFREQPLHATACGTASRTAAPRSRARGPPPHAGRARRTQAASTASR
jgi:hypothetical protein